MAEPFSMAPQPLEERMGAAGVPLSGNVVDNRAMALDPRMKAELMLRMLLEFTDPSKQVSYPDTSRRASSLAQDAGHRDIGMLRRR